MRLFTVVFSSALPCCRCGCHTSVCSSGSSFTCSARCEPETPQHQPLQNIDFGAIHFQVDFNKQILVVHIVTCVRLCESTLNSIASYKSSQYYAALICVCRHPGGLLFIIRINTCLVQYSESKFVSIHVGFLIAIHK